MDSPSSPAPRDWLRLARAPGIGPSLGRALIDRFGSPSAVFTATRRELAALPGLGRARVDALLDPALSDRVDAECERAAAIGVHFLCPDDDAYPPALRGLQAPPLTLSVRGTLLPADRAAITVIGPRMPSDYGRRMTRRLVPPLASRGLTIVSGLAQGIDAEAHAAALRTSGRTLAVLGQGLDTPVFPASNRELAERIVAEGRGALVSAFPLDTRPQAALYPQRNELLAALGMGVLVVEAGERSGALITARHALDFGRAVLACPGDADRTTARGSNQLLADGAFVAQTSDDVLRALRAEIRQALLELGVEGPADPPTQEPPIPPPISPAIRADVRASSSSRGHSEEALTRAIRAMLEEEHRPLDFILQACARAGFPHGAVVQRLLELELQGGLRQLPGRIYARPD